MSYRSLFPVLLQALFESVSSSVISNHLGKEFTATHCMKIPSCCFKSGCNSFIWWALVHALVETVASPYCWSYPWFCTHQLCIPWFFFSLCQTEESQPTQLFLIGCSLVLLLPFPNSVYPEMRYQILLGFKWDLNHLDSLDLFEIPFPNPRIGTWFSAYDMDIVTPKCMVRC